MQAIPLTRRHAKFCGIPSSRSADIKDFSKFKMAAVPPFGSSSKVKTHREHTVSIASMRRSAKLGRNRSSGAGDIKDFNKSKMAVVPQIPHFGSSSNVKTHREHIYNLIATTCKIW